MHFNPIRQGILLLILLGCCVLVKPSCAAPLQDSVSAVLIGKLAAQPTDTARVRLLTDICYALHDTEPTRALTYGEQAVDLAVRLHDRPGQLRGLLTLASCYANLSDGPHALELQQQALTLARQLRDANGIVRAYTGIGSIHHERNDTASALHSYLKAMELVYDKNVKTRSRLLLFGNLGSLYSYLHNSDKALLYTHRALRLARTSGDRAGESLYTANLGLFYFQHERYDIAEGLLRQALVLVAPTQNYRYEVAHLELLATMLLVHGKQKDALALTRRALALARRIDYKERVLDAYSLLAEISATDGDFEAAFSWQSMFRDLNDSLNSRSRLQTLAALQTRYETAEKESEIRLLTQNGQLQQLRNRELWVVVAALLLGLGGMAVLYWQLRRSRAALTANNTALHEASRELRELAASKDRLYAIVAHDLRGPVTSFVGVTELIDFYLKQGDDTGLRRLPALVRQSAQSLNSLLDNLLNWAVSQTGELVNHAEQLPVAELFAEIQELYRTTAEAKQIELVACTTPDSLTVWADRNMTRTILRNLVGNALKFTPDGGRITLEGTALDGAGAVLTVADNGRGMAPEQVEGLLNADATRLAQPRTLTNRSGTGLGLPLCRAFAQRLGGTLAIESAPKIGTTVRVTLPTLP